MADRRLPEVWNQRHPINYPKQLEVAGGIAAPLLAGFSLTTVAQLVIGSDHPWLSEWATALFALAAALLIFAVQLSAKALGYAATPSERLDYNPEAASIPEVLKLIRRRQWEEMELRAKYSTRARFCYNGGLLAFLSGLGLILVPHSSWPWPWGRVAGVAIVSISLLVEIIWTASNGSWPRWLLPGSSTVEPFALDGEGAKYLFDRHADSGDALAQRRVESGGSGDQAASK
jgi:hypothetical protein